MSNSTVDKIVSFNHALLAATERYVEETKKNLEVELKESATRLMTQGLTPTVITKALDESTAILEGVAWFGENGEGWEKGVLHWADFAETQPALRGLSYPSSSDGVARRKHLADLPLFSRTSKFYREMEQLVDGVEV